MGDPLDSAQDTSTELQPLRCSVLERQRELLVQRSEETGLATSLAHFTALCRTLQSGLLYEDATRRITFINEAFCAMFGISGPDCLIGMDGRAAAERVQTLCVDQARFLSQIERAVTEQVPVKGEEIRLADGRWLEWDYASVIVDGVCAGHVWSYRDITERKRTEEVLYERERAMRTLVASLPGVVYRCLNDPNWTLEYISDQVRDLVGYGPDEFLSRRVTWAQLIHRDDVGRVWNEVQAAVAQARPYQLEYRIRAHDGQELSVWEQGQAVTRPDWSVAALEGFIMDITERKRAEQALKNLVEGTASVTGEAFFPVLVQHLAAALDARFSLVTELADRSRTRLRTLAVWKGDRLGRNFEYDTRGTPCEVVLAEGSA